MASCSLDGTHIFRFIECVTLQPFTSFLQDGGQKVSSGMAPVLMAMSTLYVAYVSIKMVLGMSSAPLAELVKTVVKIGAINMIALNFGTYMEFVATPLSNGIPNTISNWLIGSNNFGNSQFDNCVAEMMKFAAKISNQGTWFEAVKYAILLIVYLGFTLFMLGWAFILTIISKGLMYFVLALGPIFVACAMFEQTRSFLTSFVNTAVTLLIQQVLVAAVVSLCLSQFMLVTAPTTADVMMGIVNACVFASCVMFILKEVPGLAQRLGNGYGFAAGKAFDALRPASEHDSSIRGGGRAGGSQASSGGGAQPSGGGGGSGGRRTETANASAPSAQAAPASMAERIGRAANAVGHAVAPSNIVGAAGKAVASAAGSATARSAYSTAAAAIIGTGVATSAAASRPDDKETANIAVGSSPSGSRQEAAISKPLGSSVVSAISPQSGSRQETASAGSAAAAPASGDPYAGPTSASSASPSASSRQETASSNAGRSSAASGDAGAGAASSSGARQHDSGHAAAALSQTSTGTHGAPGGRSETATGDTEFASVEIETGEPLKRD